MIQKGEESDHFLSPSLHLSRGLGFPLPVPWGLEIGALRNSQDSVTTQKEWRSGPLAGERGGKTVQREGEREVTGRGRVTGPNSWAPAASVILRNKEAEKVI